VIVGDGATELTATGGAGTGFILYPGKANVEVLYFLDTPQSQNAFTDFTSGTSYTAGDYLTLQVR
jgi:hypothetical protein